MHNFTYFFANHSCTVLSFPSPSGIRSKESVVDDIDVDEIFFQPSGASGKVYASVLLIVLVIMLVLLFHVFIDCEGSYSS